MKNGGIVDAAHSIEYSTCNKIVILVYVMFSGHAVAQLVEALRYKREGREFDSQWCH
jgi:hypothetical protein